VYGKPQVRVPSSTKKTPNTLKKEHIKYKFYLHSILLHIKKRIGATMQRFLGMVDTFYCFGSPQIQLPIQTGWLSELEGSWNEDRSGDSHVTGGGTLQVFWCNRCIYYKIPMCKLLHRSRTCRLITIINKH